MYWNNSPFISLDTETTGFGKNDRICEIALLVVQGDRVLETFHSLVDPECWISEGATAVHGIRNDDIIGKPKFHEIRDRVLSFLLRDIPWVAHQMSFDARMLSYVIPTEQWPREVPTLCSMEFAKKHHPSLKLRAHHKLLDVAGALQINYDPGEAHNALTDADLLGKIVPVMMGERRIDQVYTKLSHQWLK